MDRINTGKDVTRRFRRGTRRPPARFTAHARTLLQNAFLENPYPDITIREDLAQKIGLTEPRVLTWFQNKRTRTRRLMQQSSPCGTPVMTSSPMTSSRDESSDDSTSDRHGLLNSSGILQTALDNLAALSQSKCTAAKTNHLMEFTMSDTRASETFDASFRGIDNAPRDTVSTNSWPDSNDVTEDTTTGSEEISGEVLERLEALHVVDPNPDDETLWLFSRDLRISYTKLKEWFRIKLRRESRNSPSEKVFHTIQDDSGQHQNASERYVESPTPEASISPTPYQMSNNGSHSTSSSTPPAHFTNTLATPLAYNNTSSTLRSTSPSSTTRRVPYNMSVEFMSQSTTSSKNELQSPVITSEKRMSGNPYLSAFPLTTPGLGMLQTGLPPVVLPTEILPPFHHFYSSHLMPYLHGNAFPRYYPTLW